MAILNIVGGVALILFGIRFLRKGLERLFGPQFYNWIERRARRPWMAAVAGVGFGAVAPSSTGQTLVALQLLRTGKLSNESVLGFLLGANLGITITVQLIALRLFDYYSLFIAGGLLLFLAGKRETVRGAGQIGLALGFIFLAMEITTRAAAAVTANPDFTTILSVLVHYPWLLVLFSAILTVVLQSSTATIGLAFAVGITGSSGHALILPAILGTNVGIGLTSLVVGWSTWEGRRLATANLVLKSVVVVVILALLPYLAGWIERSPGGLLSQAANFHTAFNFLVTVLGVAFATPLGKMIARAISPGREANPGLYPPTHLDPAALEMPVFALANATRETLRLADAVKAMFEGGWQAFITGDASRAAEVQKHDDRIDELNAGIKVYLSQISAHRLVPADQQLQFGLLNFSSQLESVADVIDKSLCGTVLKHNSSGISLLPEDHAGLEELYHRVLHRFDSAISVLATRDRTLAEQFLQDGDELKEWSIAAQKRHYERLVPTNPQALASSTRFLDAFNVLRRISGQLNTIGHTFLLPK